MRQSVAMLSLMCFAVPAFAQSAQDQLDSILHKMPPNEVASRRSACATGQAPQWAADARDAGFERPDASAWCIAVLTRQGMDGTLGYIRDPRSDKPTPALAFDSGFVGGFQKQSVPAGAPTMATLMPIAERCLGQTEADINLCNAAGQIIGGRAARGEAVTLR